MIDLSKSVPPPLQAAIIPHPVIVSLDTAVRDVIAKLAATYQYPADDSELAKPLTAKCALVTDENYLFGIFTTQDILQLMLRSTAIDPNLTIGEVIKESLVTLDIADFTDLAATLQILDGHHISHLPLINHAHQLVGLLTRESLQQQLDTHQQCDEQLKLNNEELTRAIQLKDEFLTNMSHELRTPLNAIAGMTEGLQEGIFGEQTVAQIEAVKTIENSSKHLLELINDILDLAKIGAGHLEMQCTPTNIYSLCHSSLAFVKHQAGQKRIKLQIKFPPQLPQIYIDERRIRQSLINLLNNAVKFTPINGEVTLDVTLESDEASASFIRFNVTDSGVGLDSKDLQKLFQPFMQFESTLSHQNKGTGLGLSLVKKMIELHGGNIQVKSEIGVGSQFIIDLPITQTEINTHSDVIPEHLELIYQTPPSTPTSPEQPLGKPCTILLAEDNEANITSLSSYLKAKGYQIILAKDGIEAVAVATSQQPSLILMDIQMPNMDGLTAIRHIRAEPKISQVPIIALTALAMSGDREKCLQAGADDYLTKPVALRKLSNLIQRLLEASADSSQQLEPLRPVLAEAI